MLPCMGARQAGPGGPWKRGESRPVRYVRTDEAVKAFEAQGVTWPVEGPEADVEERVASLVRERVAPKKPLAGATLLEQVVVEKDPRGGITVTVPMGTRVTIVQREQ